MQTNETRRPAARSRRSNPAPRRASSAGDIVYTPPKPFNRKRLLLRLATVVAVVLAIVLGMSIFFKVKNVYVSGISKYSAWDVREASGIQDGENLLTLNRAKIAGSIKTNLPYADDVRVGIRLPDTVNIEIVELDVTYAIQASDNTWWLMNANGTVVDRSNSSDAKTHTQVLGVLVEVPQIGQTVSAAQPAAETTAATEPANDASQGDAQDAAQDAVQDAAQDDAQSAPVSMPAVTASQQLEQALQILKQLEANGVMGQIASVDVSDISDLQMWYGQHYQVRLGDNSRLDYKIASMKAAVAQMGQFQSGTLDVSFTTWPNEVGYIPF